MQENIYTMMQVIYNVQCTVLTRTLHNAHSTLLTCTLYNVHSPREENL